MRLLVVFNIVLVICGCDGATQPPSPAPPQLDAAVTPPDDVPSSLSETRRPDSDIRNRLHEHGRSANWAATSINLGDTGYEARVGPVTYQDIADRQPDFYTTNVELPVDGRSYVVFQQDFLIEEVPASLLRAQAKEVVSYDHETRTVIFDVGEEEVRYVLPSVP